MKNPAAAVQAIAFDLDGTLIDTAPDIGAALNHALRGSGLARVDFDSARRWIGDGPDRLIERALAHLQVPATPALQRDLRAAFDAATLAAPLQHGRVFAGIATLLAGWFGVRPMTVVTNKPSALSRRVLDAAGLLGFFASVHGADAPEQRKPAPALLLAAASTLGVAPGALLMVGDSANDLRCAQAAGCPAAWVAWGYGPWPQDAARDTWRITTPDELHLRLA
jgi:phosphoglycolate phosphatase